MSGHSDPRPRGPSGKSFLGRSSLVKAKVLRFYMFTYLSCTAAEVSLMPSLVIASYGKICRMII